MTSISGETRKGTCNCCGKVRKLEQRNKYWYYCSECKDLTNEQRAQKRAEIRAAKQAEGGKPRFAYPCIAGPLDGEYATTVDMSHGGMYAHLANEYEEYNAAYANRKRIGAQPSMVYIHKSKLLPLISPRSR